MIRILVPVDFSEASKNALLYAILLFKDSPLAVTVLHIFGAKSTAFVMKNVDDIFERTAHENMEEFLSDIQEEFPDVVFNTEITKNYAIDTIVEMGDSGRYDYVIMGTKGTSGLKEVFMGSVAGGVVSKTKAPVIVVPKGYEFKSLTQLILAVGDDRFSDPEVIAPLRKLLATHGSKLNLLHIAINEPPQIDDALAAIDDLNPAVTYVFGTGDTTNDLHDYMQTDDSDMLCLIRTKKEFFERLLNESVTLKSTFNCKVPLLILHD